MSDLGKQISALMRRVRDHGQLPGSEQIVAETFELLGYVPGTLAPDEVLSGFDELLRHVWRETLHVLERHEERSYAEGIPRELIRAYPDSVAEAREISEAEGFAAGVQRLLSLWYPQLRRCFLSVSQSRKTRGGKDFELQLERLLTLAEVPHESQERQNRTDLVLPGVAAFERNRNEAMVVSVKRTLRERWREVAEELFNLRAPNVYLLTADESATTGHVEGICGRYNIYLVVWDHVKRDRFASEPLVLGYTEWATDRVAQMRG